MTHTLDAGTIRRSPFLGWRAHVCVAWIAFGAQAIGMRTLAMGNMKLVVLPMVWALLFGLVVSFSASKGLAHKLIDDDAKSLAAGFVQIVLLAFLAKLGLLIGPQIPALTGMGWALLFQEFGHFFGTIVIALPLALLLGLKREAIGATFSVGREPNIAIISDRYGLDSPEGRGIIGEYLTGSTIGAPFMALFATLIVSLNLFDPMALAMGAGVGSASMLAAIASTIVANVDPAVGEKVMAVAAAANILTTVLGTYFTLFVSLPCAVYLYNRLEPMIGRRAAYIPPAPSSSRGFSFGYAAQISFAAKVVALLLSSSISLVIGNWLGYGVEPVAALPGMAIVILITIAGDRIATLLPFRIPAVCIVSLVAMAATAPFHPFAHYVSSATAQVNPLAFATPALAYVGLAVADELAALRHLGWRIVVVSLVSAVGSFIGASLVAQIFGH